MVQHLMLWALIANTLFTAICAYCLTRIALHFEDSKDLNVFSGISKKVIIAGGITFICFLVYASFMLYGYMANYNVT